MRETLNALWGMLTNFINGTNSFVSAYAAVGEVAEEAAVNYRDEERIRNEATRKQLAAELAALD